MYALEDFTRDLQEAHKEIVFQYEGDTYIVSESMGAGPNGEPYRFAGPNLSGYADSIEALLDAITLNGEPLRARLDEIAPL